MTKLDLQLWTKVPKYEDVVRAIEKDYKVTLPERTALTFWDSFAMSHYREMVTGLEGAQEAGRSHQQMEAAMEQAAGEEGVTRREMMTFMDHLQAQNTGAAAQLQRNLDEATVAHRRALQEQGDQFARALAGESQRAGRRERAGAALSSAASQAGAAAYAMSSALAALQAASASPTASLAKRFTWLDDVDDAWAKLVAGSSYLGSSKTGYD